MVPALLASSRKEFSTLASAISSGAQRVERFPVAVTSADAAVQLHKFHEVEAKKVRLVKTASDQSALAALEKPCRYFPRLQRLLYAGPTARKDAEEDERVRWVSVSAALPKGTDTPMVRLLIENPENATPLGGDRRESTLHGSCQSSKEVLGLVVHLSEHAVPLQNGLTSHTTSLRSNRNFTRGTPLKGAYNGQELLSKAFQGKVTRQAPRMYTSMLGGPRGHHRRHQEYSLGLKPVDVAVKNHCLSAKLTRSKTIDEDRQVTFRPVAKPDWVTIG